MSLRTSYTLIAPVYDWIVGPALAHARARSLRRLSTAHHSRILLNGVGTGLDLPLLPATNHYTALDLTRAMLQKALPRGRGLDMTWIQGDSQRLPFGDNTFDHVVLHLILAIVPDTRAALREATRVVRPGGHLYLLDKFLRPGKTAWLRRAINPLLRRIATRTDVVFEDALAGVRGLRVLDDQPALAGGWFRMITLEKTTDQGLPEASESSSRRGQINQMPPPSNTSTAATSSKNHSKPLMFSVPA